ncbi:sugar transferase [Periweissella cryptocerci]|uniref:Sugar transferase n=1 Tax=Periweissella cryptocerci TaxID=2506420 RepID=A0A4P6YWC3_9LACO|nr:sugar transferase [Periweissella cryptocerci]QBO37073.1 sugar transferase [Periweissella cryptocerci]
MYKNYIKRYLDIIMALIILICASPIMLITALAIKFESKGPAIFKQERVGIHSVQFTLKKFRSMRIDTPEVASNDLDAHDYHTKIGTFIRKVSIDELPQLFNVLTGEMSMIGPRPLIRSEREVLLMRHAGGADRVRPGLTGLAQVNGRDTLDDEAKANFDSIYASDVTFMKDAKIVVRTMFYVLGSKGIVEDKISKVTNAERRKEHKLERAEVKAEKVERKADVVAIKSVKPVFESK